MAIRSTSSGDSLLLTTAAMLICIGLIGCGQTGRSVPVPSNSDMLRGIIRTYVTAAGNLNRPPQSMDDLKAVVAPVDKDTDKYFRSKRDGEEFVVVWGLNLQTIPSDNVVAYERKGAGGTRMVLTVGGDIQEVTPEGFSQLKFPKGYTPDSGS
jgi:hypothetical protein